MAVDFFLKLDGIKGESRDKTHAGQIDVLSWSWGTSNSSSASSGGAGAGKVDMQDFHFVTYTNAATMDLLGRSASGKHITDAYLYARKAGTTPIEYLEWKLEDVVVSTYQVGGSGAEETTLDQFSLSFGKVTGTYKEQRADGSIGTSHTFTWDLKASTGG